MAGLEALLALCAGLGSVPALVLLVECVAARSPGARSTEGDATLPAFVVLVPAHDEEVSLPRALDSIRGELRDAGSVLVVADNCRDATAERARAGGARVVVREDPARRGKGYALAFGLEQLAAAPPEVVVVVDADCRVEPGSLALLVRRAAALGRPCQAAYRMDPPPGAPVALSAFALRVKNWVRPLGQLRLGWPCPLMGSGMAFPWQVIRAVALDGDNLVEDMKLGVDLVAAGHPPRFVPEALVRSDLPARSEAARSQRRRWEHGHLHTLLTEGPRLLLAALARRDLAGAAFALDLLVPPLSLLALWLGGVGVLSALALLLGAGPLPLALSAGALGGFTAAVLIAWVRHGRDLVGASALLLAPVYALRKLPLYASFWRRRQREWVRTERPPGP